MQNSELELVGQKIFAPSISVSSWIATSDSRWQFYWVSGQSK